MVSDNNTGHWESQIDSGARGDAKGTNRGEQEEEDSFQRSLSNSILQRKVSSGDSSLPANVNEDLAPQDEEEIDRRMMHHQNEQYGGGKGNGHWI